MSELPYPSFAALAKRHEALLEALAKAVGAQRSAAAEAEALTKLEPELHAFMTRCVETGAILDELGERTQAQALHDYWANVLRRAQLEVPRARLAAFDPERLPDFPDHACPWPGTEAFDAGQALFGCEPELDEVLARIDDHRVVVICGPSASGKTSLLRAGVLPRLAPERRCELVTPGTAPLERLREALTRAPTMLVVDQLEELFDLTDDAQRSAFDEALAAFLDQDPGHQLLLCVTEELLERLAWLPQLTERLEQGNNQGRKPGVDKGREPGRALVRLRPLSQEAMARAITGPAAALGLQLKPGVVDLILLELRGRPAPLPTLQFLLRKLWSAREHNRITLAAARSLGDPRELIDAEAERGLVAVIAATDVDETALRRVLLALVRIDDLLDDHRQGARVSELLELAAPDGAVLLERLEAEGLIRVHADVVALRHEGLIRHWGRLRTWIKQARRIQRSARRALADAAQAWDAAGRPSDGLYRRLQVVEARKSNGLTKLELEFLAASDEQREREHAARDRDQRRLIGVAVGAAVIFLGLAVSAFWALSIERQRAHLEATNVVLETANTELTKKSTEQQTEITKKQEEIEHSVRDVERLTVQTSVLDEQLEESTNALAETKQMESPSIAPEVRDELRGNKIEIHYAQPVQKAAVDEVLAKLPDRGFANVNAMEGPGLAPAINEVRYRCAEDKKQAEALRDLVEEWLEIQVELRQPKGPAECSRVERGVVELWLAPHTLTVWIQVASDANLADAHATLRNRNADQWGTPELMILERRAYHVVMVGPYPTVKAAREAIEAAPTSRYALGRYIRPLDSFCPVRTPLTSPPRYGEWLYRCERVPALVMQKQDKKPSPTGPKIHKTPNHPDPLLPETAPPLPTLRPEQRPELRPDPLNQKIR